ncbi:hypothetical protein BH09BAC3_BH09BAC3_25750 [soil metagenome]
MNERQLIKLCITTTILTIGTLTAFGQDCEKLADGQYLFKHKTKGHKKADFTLSISGDQFIIIKDGQEGLKGEIKWWPDNCMFKIYSDDKAPDNLDSLNSVQKTLIRTSMSYGGSCYELVGRRKFRLTYCGNVHITMSEGRVIKKGR